jgi:hypothetical protein
MSLSLTNRREFESARGWRAKAKPPRCQVFSLHGNRIKPILRPATIADRHPARLMPVVQNPSIDT